MFVVLEDRPARRVHPRHAFQHLRAEEGVLPDHLRLLLAQPALLRQEVPGNADDPHVVQLRGVPQGGEIGRGKPHPLADPRGQVAHPVRVPGEEGEAQLERVRQGGEDGKGEGADVLPEFDPLGQDRGDLGRDRRERLQIFVRERLVVLAVRKVKRPERLAVMRQRDRKERFRLVAVLLELSGERGVLRAWRRPAAAGGPLPSW